MGAMLRSWWKQIKQHRVAIGVVGIALVVVITLIIAGYWFDWTGFNGYNKITTTHTISGTNAGTVNKTEEYQPGKALWDWLNLLGVLAIPAVVGLGAAWYTAQQGKVSDRENSDNQRETALQEYIDKMSELLLHENLRHSDPDAEVRKIARARTLTVLPRLDSERKSSVLRFLYESGLIAKGKPIVDLSGVDLTEVDLKRAFLSGASLSGADLHGVDLRGANLFLFDLHEADLGGANLEGTNLASTNLEGATLIRAALRKANLLGAFMKGADLREANLESAFLAGADLENTDLQRANLEGATLSFANLHDADLREAILESSLLNGADLHGVDLEGAKITGANLSFTNLEKARVTNEQLEVAKSLKDATLPDGSIHP